MDARYKPSGSDFNLCETGRMLIISADLPTPLSRQSCLAMNSLAERICQETQRGASNQADGQSYHLIGLPKVRMHEGFLQGSCRSQAPYGVAAVAGFS